VPNFSAASNKTNLEIGPSLRLWWVVGKWEFATQRARLMSNVTSVLLWQMLIRHF